jgi:hypothetical protein
MTTANAARLARRHAPPLLSPRRSIVQKAENDVEDDATAAASSDRPLIRKRRYSKKYIGPVYTYVKTDKHAHYKWGVKHKVGKHYG